MAYQFVQYVENTIVAAGTSITVTVTPAAVGNLLLVGVTTNVASSVVTDTAGNAWTRIAGQDVISVFTELWWAKSNGTVATTITSNWGSSHGSRGIFVVEYSGISAPLPFITSIGVNQQTSPGTGANAVTSGTALVNVVPALVFGLSRIAPGLGSVGMSAGTGFTSRSNVWLPLSSGGTTPLGLIEDLRLTTVGTQAATTTVTSGAGNFFTVMAAFAEQPQPQVIAVQQSQPLNLTGPQLFDPRAFAWQIVGTQPTTPSGGSQIGISQGRRRFHRYT